MLASLQGGHHQDCDATNFEDTSTLLGISSGTRVALCGGVSFGERNSHSSAMPVISVGEMSQTAVSLGQRGEAANCRMEETSGSRLKSVTGRKESICNSSRTAPACTQRLQLRVVFCTLREPGLQPGLCCHELP